MYRCVCARVLLEGPQAGGARDGIADPQLSGACWELFVIFLSWFEVSMLHKRPCLVARSSHFRQWDVFTVDRGIGRKKKTPWWDKNGSSCLSHVLKREPSVLRLFVSVFVHWTTVVQMARPPCRWVEASGVKQLMTKICWEDFTACKTLEQVFTS